MHHKFVCAKFIFINKNQESSKQKHVKYLLPLKLRQKKLTKCLSIVQARTQPLTADLRASINWISYIYLLNINFLVISTTFIFNRYL